WFGLVSPGRLKISLLVMLAGAIDEFHQYFLPFRQARISDVLLDTAAAMLAVLLLAWLQRRLQPVQAAPAGTLP
ncbi:MAG: VanZ family protein, partial [Janthinobacterium lividum]